MSLIKYKRGYKYQLAEDYHCQTEVTPGAILSVDFVRLIPTGQLTLYKGYACDGPSGPTFDGLMPRLYRWFMRGAFIHDVLYQLMRAELLDQEWRKQADRELYLACRADGMWRARAAWIYYGVRKGAEYAARPGSKKIVLSAP